MSAQREGAPKPWASALAVLATLPAGFALLFFTFLAQHDVLARSAGSLTGGVLLAIAALAAQRLPQRRLPAAFGAGVFVSFFGGPLALSATLFVVGLQQGAGVRAFGAIVVAIMGMACGWFISIPIGVAVGLYLMLVVFAIDRIPGARRARDR